MERAQGFRAVARKDPEWTSSRYPGDHAGASEMSYMLYFVPQTVKMELLPGPEVKDLTEYRIRGDPRQASAERGKAQLAMLLTNSASRRAARPSCLREQLAATASGDRAHNRRLERGRKSFEGEA